MHAEHTDNPNSSSDFRKQETISNAPAHGRGPFRAASPPNTIGPYKILETLGEGGMGTVYLAEQDKPRRVVALKVIKPGYASRQMLKRFDQESQVLGRLQHPGIAQIYEAGTHEVAPGAAGKHGVIVPYFAMEFIRGRGLKEFMEEAKLGTRQRLELVAKICDAVHHAHQKGVIHRDLKPGNILVDESGQPKILDFGVARATDSDIQAATIQTDVGQLIGTIPYMSPEQVAADPQELDTRSDVYALGVIAYEALAGRLPYDLKHKMIHEAARVIREEEPAPLSTVDRVFRGDVETIVAKSLEKDKTRRYQSAAELASDIRRYLHDEPIVARPASAAYQFKKFAQRNKAVVVGVAAVFLVLVAGMIVSTTLYFRAENARVEQSRERARAENALLAEAEQRRIALDNEARAQENEIKAQKEAEVARKERDKAQITSSFMSDILKGAGPSVAIGRDATMLREMLDGASKRIRDGELNNAPEAEVQLRGTIGMTYDELGVYDQARNMIEPTMEQARRLYGDEHAEVATSLHNFATYLQNQGNNGEAERLEREALAMRRKLLGEVHPEVARSLYTLSAAICNQDRYSEAEPLQREALAIRRKLHGEEHPAVAESLSNLAAFLQTYGKYPESEQLQREAVAMQRKLLGDDHPALAISLNYLTSALEGQGKYSEAEPVTREALAMRRKLLGDEHPEVATSLYELAWILRNLGNYPESERLYREALAMNRKLLGDEHPTVAANLNGLALILDSQGNYLEAEQLFRESLALNRKLNGEENRSVATNLNNLASVLYSQGNYPEAERMHREALAMRRKLLGEEHPDVAPSLYLLARALERQGNCAEAEALARDALRICETKLPPDHSWRLMATGVLGRALLGRQQFAEAEPLLLAAQKGLKDRADLTSSRKRENVEYLVKLYDAWDAAEPGKGYAEKAAKWQAKLEETSKNKNPETPR